MKKRTILPIAGLVVLSGIAAISGTFAWFQTSRTASITFNDATVRATGSNLVVKYTGSLNTLDAQSTDEGVVPPVGGHAAIDLKIDKAGNEAQFVTDISGDGVKFYKPNWGHVVNPNEDKVDGVSNYKAHSITHIGTTNAGDANGYYIDFSIELSRALIDNAQAADLQVHLGAATGVFPVDDQKAADVAAVAASRMAITNTTAGANPSDDILFVPVAEPPSYQRDTGPYTLAGNAFDNSTPLYSHLAENAEAEAYGLSGYEIVGYGGQIQVGAFEDVPVYAAGNDTLAKGYLVTLSDQNPVSLNFRVWIEGTDSNAGEFNYDAVTGQIKVEVELYALEVA